MKSSSVSECGYSSFFKDYPSDCKYRCLCHLQSDAKSGYVCPRCHPEFTPPQSGKRLTTTRQLKKKGLQDSGKKEGQMIKKLGASELHYDKNGKTTENVLANKINEIIDHLQSKEESSNYKIVSFDPVGETVPEVSKTAKKTGVKWGNHKTATKHCDICNAEKGWIHLYEECTQEASKVTIKNNRKFVEVETEPSKLYWSGEASKGECTCKLENNYHFTGCKKHKCYIDGFCDLCSKHKYSDPPEHEESWEKQIRDENWDTEDGIMTKQVYLRHGKKIGTATTPLKVEMIIDYIRDNFVSKEKIKRELSEAHEISGFDTRFAIDEIAKSLGLGD